MGIIVTNIYRKVTKTVDEVSDCICNKCGDSLLHDFNFCGLEETTVCGGYDSSYFTDCTKYSFALCEKCLRELFDSFINPPEIKSDNYCSYEEERLSWYTRFLEREQTEEDIKYRFDNHMCYYPNCFTVPTKRQLSNFFYFVCDRHFLKGYSTNYFWDLQLEVPNEKWKKCDPSSPFFKFDKFGKLLAVGLDLDDLKPYDDYIIGVIGEDIFYNKKNNLNINYWCGLNSDTDFNLKTSNNEVIKAKNDSYFDHPICVLNL